MIWKSHEHYFFEVHPRHDNRTAPVRYEEALKLLAAGDGFFGVVPRLRSGNKKEDCVPEFDVLWVDIDRTTDTDPHALLEEIKTRLPEAFYPSAVAFTGNKGLHCYWKLDRMLPIGEVERWCKVLAMVLGGDLNCHDSTRILAHPGVPNRKSGRLGEIIEFSCEVHPSERLALLPTFEDDEEPTQRRKVRDRPLNVEDEAWFIAAEQLNCWGEPPDLDLVNWLLGIDQAYLSTYKSQGWKRGKETRSEMEMHIVHVLVRKGASDDQIVALADGNFSKHDDEPSYRYIELTIRSAREYCYEHGWLTHPQGGLPKRRAAKYRWGSLNELEAYVHLVNGQPLKEWVAEVTESGKSKSTAYRYKNDFEEAGLVEVREHRIFRVTAADGRDDTSTEGGPVA